MSEEMGLGKTIEILSLVNSNPSPPVKPPYCLVQKNNDGADVKEKRHPTKATLIIAPTSLVGQWDIEITKWYKKKPKTLLYYGSKRNPDPSDIASYDYVLTTYNLLTSKKERERYKSPLSQLDWWRVVLDESHKIKSGSTRKAKECARFKAVNRWCMTGTPLNKNIRDLKTQFGFLGLKDPIANKKWWERSSDWFMANDQSRLCPIYQLMDKLVMRHKKSQKFNDHDIVELPEKKELEVGITLSESQKKVYQMLFQIARTKYEAYKKAGLLNSCYLTVNSFLMPLRMCCSGGEFVVAEIQEKLDKVQSGVGLPQPSMAQAMGVGQQKFAVTEEEAYNANEECSICIEVLEEPLQTPCRHVFCGDCIKPHIITQGERCPICRKPIKLKDLKIPKGYEKKEPPKIENLKKVPDGSLERVIFDPKPS